MSYKLTTDILEKYKDKKVPWGFNGLGYIVYKRTYSRLQNNGTYEEWPETILRCINGAQDIGAHYSATEAKTLFDYMFNLKCTFAGRMLWMLGTEHVKRWGANALINCFFTTIAEPSDFCFLFENLMLGGGVGFSVRREDIHELPKIKENVIITHKNTKDADFIVPDSREGWVYLLGKVLKSYFVTGKSFTYSTILVRGYGEQIKGLGGTASGPQILVEGITNICSILDSRQRKKLRSIDVLDVCNIIASIVVSGNIRRSATISLGDPDDYLYLRAKRWDLGNIPNWRAMSNNSLYIDDFSHIHSDVWEGYQGNGEPYGFLNIKLAQKVGRLNEPRKDNAEGVNPCFRGDTLIETTEGKIPIKELVGKEVQVYCYDLAGKITTSLMKNIRKTGEKHFVLKVYLNSGSKIYCTLDHKFMLKDGSYKEARLLTSADELMASNLLINNVRIIKHEMSGILVDVYDGEVEKYHNFALAAGVIVHNCGELVLGSAEICCLSDIYLNNITSKAELTDCAKLLYKTQKAICALNFLHEQTNKIVHKNFRIGIGVTGICQSMNKLDWLDDCYNEVREFDKEWSNKQGYPESIRISTLKPSGSVSLLAGATPGVHPAYSKYYIRRIRMASDDKLVKVCKDLGYTVDYVNNFDGTKDHKTTIIEFPCYAGENVITAKEMTAVKQLELVKKLMTLWADNSISVTVYYKKEELEDIKAWLKENYKNNLKSVSFLLHKDHGFEQAPYEEITEEQYKELIDKIKPISTIIDNESKELDVEECKGACPIK